MSSYPGNPSLGDEVKQRILATYRQSVDLAETGRQQEALLGCDFVLELDPQFAPARTLRERLSGGPSAAAPDGAPQAAGPAAAGDGELPDLDDLDDLSILPELDDPFELAPEPAGGGAPNGGESADALFEGAAPAGPSPLVSELRVRLEARDFDGVLELAAAEPEAVAADPDATGAVETARTRLEAQPYVEGFLRKAGSALRGGEIAAAAAELDKVTSLDPGHPLLHDLQVRLEEARRGAGGTPSSPAAAPAPPPEPPSADPFDLSGGEAGLPDLGALDGAGPGSGGGSGLDEAPELDDDLLSLDALSPSSSPVRGDGEDRIDELLAEGDEAASAGDYQGAIDLWSRIFLIDVDHQEAARRIEAARRQKAEREREVEEAFHEGLAALEAGETDTARGQFERVLAMQPGHLAAADYLRQIESGEPVAVRTGPSPDETIALGSLGTFDLSDLSKRPSDAAGEPLREEILVPPEPGRGAGAEEGEGAPRAVPSYGPAQARREPGRRSFFLVGGAVLLLVAAAAWWLFANKESVFPNSDAPEVVAPVGPATTPGPIERATDLHEQGRTAMALGMLRRIRPDDPRYGEAQDLIARWEAPGEAPVDEEGSAVPTEAEERRRRLLGAARAALAEREHLLALQLFDRAGRIAPLDDAASALRRSAEESLAPLASEVAFFESGDYDQLLPRLWRRYQEEPGNRDVRRMLVTSYYNRGVRELQRGAASAAADEFAEALEIDQDDEELRRHQLFAEAYEGRPKDLLYRIYVKYLPTR